MSKETNQSASCVPSGSGARQAFESWWKSRYSENITESFGPESYAYCGLRDAFIAGYRIRECQLQCATYMPSGPPWYASQCRLLKGHSGECEFGTEEEARQRFYEEGKIDNA